jgi:hypothetical protein
MADGFLSEEVKPHARHDNSAVHGSGIRNQRPVALGRDSDCRGFLVPGLGGASVARAECRRLIPAPNFFTSRWNISRIAEARQSNSRAMELLIHAIWLVSAISIAAILWFLLP